MNTLEKLSHSQLLDYLCTKFPTAEACLIWEKLILGDDLTTEEVDQYLLKDTFDSEKQTLLNKPTKLKSLDKLKELLSTPKKYTRDQLAKELGVSFQRVLKLLNQCPNELQAKVIRKIKKKDTWDYKMILPTQLIEDVYKLSLTKCYTNKAFKFLDLLNKKSKFEIEQNMAVMLTHTYLDKAFGYEHAKFIKPLTENGIISKEERGIGNAYANNFYKIEDKYFSKKTVSGDDVLSSLKRLGSVSVPAKYNNNRKSQKFVSPNLEMLDNEQFIETDNFDEKNLVEQENAKICIQKIKKNLVEQENVRKGILLQENFIDCVSQLKINQTKLREKVASLINNIKIEDYNCNEDINATFFPRVIKRVNGKQTEYSNKSLAYCQTMIKDKTSQLIQDKKVLYIVDSKTEFIEKKKIDLLSYCVDVLKKLEQEVYYATRNNTNNRLDNNFTNMKKVLFNIILEDNNLVSLDAANCQYAIFAHKAKTYSEINTKEDFLLYQKLVESGEFYQYICDSLGLKDKDEAKAKMMEFWFSSYKNNTAFKKNFKEIFPSVVEWIDNFKKSKSTTTIDRSNKFSIMLQCFESEVFVDNLLMSCINQNIFCITKHDSLIVKKEDEERVREIMKEYFESINFKVKINK